jgi:hypothetical protein
MEKRAAPRKPVLMSGAIEFAGSVINCLISNISISGAAIEVTSPHDPSASILSLRRTARTFLVTSSGAKRIGSASPLIETGIGLSNGRFQPPGMLPRIGLTLDLAIPRFDSAVWSGPTCVVRQPWHVGPLFLFSRWGRNCRKL